MCDLYFVFFIVFIAFVFEFINGFHDAANSIATIVATGVLKPLTAVLWAAFFNFIAFMVFHLSVANTFGVGLVNPTEITPYVIFSALSGAIIFNLITWYFGIPASSSHALIGGLMGAVLAQSGWHNLEWLGLGKTFVAILISPALGILLSITLVKLLRAVFKEKRKHFDRHFQLFSSALLSLGHGGNDAQKTMGIIALLLLSSGLISDFHVPFWVMMSCSVVMGIGTLAGGWRIVKTVGEKITKLTPETGAAAETGSAFVLFIATYLGIPVSTTHIVTGSVTGVGLQQGWKAVNWQVLKRITISWMLTIPCSGFFAAGFIWVHSAFFV